MPPESLIAELDPSEPRTRFQLAPTPTSRREIFARWQSRADACQVLSILDRSFPYDASAIPRETERFLDLRNDLILPLYAVPRAVRHEWNFELGYGGGASRIDYPFESRADAERLQALVTGYEVVAHVEGVTCIVTYRGLGIRASQYVGCGEVQLWQQQDGGGDELSPPSSVSGGSSQVGGSSLARTVSVVSAGNHSTVQTYGERGRAVLVRRRIAPPLLVAFLKGREKGGGYTMLKLDISDLHQTQHTTRTTEALLSITHPTSSTFPVDKHLPDPDQVALSAWDIAHIRCPSPKNSSTAQRLKCKHFALNFGSEKDPPNAAQRDVLDRSLLLVRLAHAERRAEQAVGTEREMLAQAREMRDAPVQQHQQPRWQVGDVSPVSTRAPNLPEIRHEPFMMDFDGEGRVTGRNSAFELGPGPVRELDSRPLGDRSGGR